MRREIPTKYRRKTKERGKVPAPRLRTQKTAGCVRVKKTPPDRDGGTTLDREEMVRILEEIIRDPDRNPTARCTAIRTLREIPQEQAADALADLYPDGFELRRTGRSANNSGAISDRRDRRFSSKAAI